jgi:hypothetical protein
MLSTCWYAAQYTGGDHGEPSETRTGVGGIAAGDHARGTFAWRDIGDEGRRAIGRLVDQTT